MLKFTTGQHDNPPNPSTSDGTNNQDANAQQEIQQNRAKRGRTDFEDNTEDPNAMRTDDRADAERLPVPDPTRQSESDSSMFSSDSASTVKIIPPREDQRIRQQEQNREAEDVHKVNVIRLERLKDKSDRYSSHIQFLKECKATKVIPKGLRIDIEPSIGNNDQDFCTKWFDRMQEFSLILMDDIIAYSEKVETETADRIAKESADLKAKMDPADWKEVSGYMDDNTTARRKRLDASKKKKYYHLRYNREPRSERERAPDRPERRSNWEEIRNPRRNHQRDSRPEWRDHHPHRDNAQRTNREEWQYDHRQPNGPQSVSRNQPREDAPRAQHHHEPRQQAGDTRVRHEREDRPRQETRQPRHREEGNNTRQEHAPRKTTYREMLTRTSSRTGRGSHLDLSRRNSRHTAANTSTNRDEPAPPRNQQTRYENNYHQKNGEGPNGTGQSTATATPPTNPHQGILDLITKTMQDLEKYKNSLTN